MDPITSPPPTLTKDATIATMDDIPDITTDGWRCTFGLKNEISVGSFPWDQAHIHSSLEHLDLYGVFSEPSVDFPTTTSAYDYEGCFLGYRCVDSDIGHFACKGLYITRNMQQYTTDAKAYLLDVSLGGACTYQPSDVIKNGRTDYYIELSELIKFRKTKQDTLVSGTNIKTINGTSLLGSGDITAGGVTITYDSTINGLVFE